MSYRICERIKELRIEKNITQEALAVTLGISRQRLSRIENGQSDISYDMICKTADFMGISVNDITSVDSEQNNDFSIYFRNQELSEDVEESVNKIIDIIKTFSAHEKLYLRMRDKNGL